MQSLGILSGLCLALFILRIFLTGVGRYWFIPENLLLAWLGLGFGWLLVQNLKSMAWKSWPNLLLSILWLVFLPNTWYVLSDFIHVHPTGEISELYDIVLMGSLVFCGFMLGLTSLFMLHKEFSKRLRGNQAYIVVELVILLASFGIYLGRDLRWSTWDVVANPGSIILNVSDRIINPLGHPRSINTTGLFFVLISVVYAAFYRYFIDEPTGRSGR